MALGSFLAAASRMLAITFFSLFLSVILIQLSSGGIGPLDVLSGLQSGFTSLEIGLLGSSHFVGFFVGCWWGPRLIGIIGHSRAFAVFAAAGTIGILAHMLWVDPYIWSAMRILSGMCIAGCFTVLEAWFQAKTDNATRGRTVGYYRLVDLLGGLFSQLLIAVLEPATYMAYNILAIICCASLLPLALTRIPQPPTTAELRLRPRLGLQISPMASAGVVIAGITVASFRMVGPVYGQAVGLTSTQIGLFLALFILGGALAQFPAGLFADRFDRRKVMFAFSAVSIGASLLVIQLAETSAAGLLAGAVIFGAATFPIYSIAAAHANDHVPVNRMVELNASLLFYFAIGAIISPLLVSLLIAGFGASSMFVFIAVAHALLCIYGLVRMTKRRVARRKPFRYMPRTSFVFTRLFKRKSDKDPTRDDNRNKDR